MNRKKKLRLYQFFFLIVGLSVILITLIQKNITDKKDEIISKDLQKKIDKQIQNQRLEKGNIFYNVKYSGLDLEGNRYTIQSDEAINSDTNTSLVKMKGVLAYFYFKDNTVLNISSKEADYNNKTLDMKFKDDVRAYYENSKLYAQKAELINSKSHLIVSKDVKIVDSKGTMFADKLIFDIKNKKLNITSLKDKMIKSKVIYK